MLSHLKTCGSTIATTLSICSIWVKGILLIKIKVHTKCQLHSHAAIKVQIKKSILCWNFPEQTMTMTMSIAERFNTRRTFWPPRQHSFRSHHHSCLVEKWNVILPQWKIQFNTFWPQLSQILWCFWFTMNILVYCEAPMGQLRILVVVIGGF